MTSSTLLQLDDVRRVFPEFELGPLSTTLEAGHVYGLLGPNGAGKTTLLNLLTLQLKPTSGRLLVGGSALRWGDLGWKQRFSYIHERPAFYDELTVGDTLDLARRLYGRWDSVLADVLLKRFRLSSAARVGLLSKGTRVKLGLVAALAHRADLLILDEPTAGLDPTARADLQDTVNEMVAEYRSLCVLLSSHIFEDIEHTATDIYILRRGRLAMQATAEHVQESVVYRCLGPSDIPASPDVLLRWSCQGTERLAVLAGSPVDRALQVRIDHIEEHVDSALGTLYHGTEYARAE